MTPTTRLKMLAAEGLRRQYPRWTIEQIAEALSVSPSTIYKWRADNRKAAEEALGTEAYERYRA